MTRTGGQAAFARAVLDPASAIPGGLTAWNGSDPAVRFAVHRNNAVASLVGALEDTFPVTRALVGDAFFAAMARAFALAAPPASPVLAWWGESLPAFVEGFEPARRVPYLADVARLEWLRVRAYHADDDTPLEAAGFGAVLGDPIALSRSRFDLTAATGAVASPHAIVSIWAAHQGAGDLAAVDPGVPEEALVTRPRLEVEVTRLPPGGAHFVSMLRDGAALGDAAAAAAGACARFELSGVLAVLVSAGAVDRIRLPAGEHR